MDGEVVMGDVVGQAFADRCRLDLAKRRSG